ncbi:retinol dehydrogenase 5-like [Argiope bruennichi]|uniref:Estradiol 17-beta-dehydrogenase 2 like protein n=1 Tax=Argiope bruennichi TaxID=94029 RepID=A0A8T0EMF2_ARGBR|nr:retinol dehydrogenase 5-like [Argiope bruennichi]KAF8773866.1 Estradiol 17-beta-dehydrogenase 2 like protein [Argiope bruennichi]
MDRWFIVWGIYFICAVLIFDLTCFIAPFLQRYSYLVAKTLFCAVIGHCLFIFIQEKVSKERVNPNGKAVFITGCDSGFGYQLAKQLHSLGYRVFAGCLFPETGGAAELKNECPGKMSIVHIDVTKDESVKKAKDFVLQNLKGCDLWALVNNAGIYKGFSVEFSKISDFQDSLDVNTLGQVRVTKAFLPLLRECKGRIINVNSLAGRIACAHMTAYSMSKFASVCFTEGLRREMAPWGIKVISIEPEFFKTPLTNKENLRKYLENTCAGVENGIKFDYGELYMDRIKAMLTDLFGLSSSKTHIVTDAIEAAISTKHPCIVYRPSANIIRYIFWYYAEKVPSHVFDAFFKMGNIVWKIPAPKAART